jgi:hypothetical protein
LFLEEVKLLENVWIVNPRYSAPQRKMRLPPGTINGEQTDKKVPAFF